MRIRITLRVVFVFTFFGTVRSGRAGDTILGKYLFQGDCIANKPEEFFIDLKAGGRFDAMYAVCHDILPVTGRYKRTGNKIRFTFIPSRRHSPIFRIEGKKLFPENKDNSFDGCNSVCKPELIYYEKE